MRRGDLGPRLNRTVLTFARGVRLARLLSNELQQSGDGLTVHAYTDLPIDYDLNKLPGVLARYAGPDAPRMRLPSAAGTSGDSTRHSVLFEEESPASSSAPLAVTLYRGGHPLTDLHCLAAADILVPACSFFSLLASYFHRGIKLDMNAFTWGNLGYKIRLQQAAQQKMGQGWLIVDDARWGAAIKEIVKRVELL